MIQELCAAIVYVVSTVYVCWSVIAIKRAFFS